MGLSGPHIQPVVAAVIVEGGRVLAAQRGQGAMAGKWEFPGGKVEAGETFQAALARELQEELAVGVQVGRQILAQAFSSNGRPMRLIAFYARRVSGVFVPVDHRAIRWLDPFLHVLATDGCFYNDGAFRACPPPKTADLEELFRHEVFKMLEAEGKITDSVIENMINWRQREFIGLIV